MARYTKPFLTPEQQVQLLAGRGMQISDIAKAESCLARIGYYRLSAYWYAFRTSSQVPQADGTVATVIQDQFRPDTHFSTVHDLYVFDKKLRLIVLDALERVEVGIRTQIAIRLGARDPWAHRNPRMLHGHFARKQTRPGVTKHDDWLVRIDDQFRKSKEDFADHFRAKYPHDKPPIWIAVELWDFGTLSHFYAGLKQADKDALANLYGVGTGIEFESWIRCLNDVRNLCAHHSRLWNRALVNPPKLPALGALPDFDHLQAHVRHQTRLYAALIILRHLLAIINPTTIWKDRLIAHVATLPPNPQVTLDSAGFPENWTALPAWITPD